MSDLTAEQIQRIGRNHRIENQPIPSNDEHTNCQDIKRKRENQLLNTESDHPLLLDT